MSVYRAVAVIYGSDSSEWEVSLRSGEFTASQIDGEKYDVYEIFARFGRWTLAAFRLRGHQGLPFLKMSVRRLTRRTFPLFWPERKSSSAMRI